MDAPVNTSTSPDLPAQPENRPIAAVLWMLLTGILFIGVNVIVKHLGGRVPAAEAAFLRYLIGIVFLLPIIRTLIQTRFERRDLGLFALRGAVHSVGVMMWFFAMTQITLAEVTATGYLAPVFVTLGAAIFLGERLAIRRLLAVAAAIVGAFIILRPGFRVLEPGHYAMMLQAFLFAGSFLIAKRMTGRYSPAIIVSMLSIMVTIGLAPFAAAVWVTPTLTELGWLVVLACLATGGHYTMTLAFSSAPMAVSQPVTFLQLVWSVSIGALLFGEPVDAWVIAGGTLILGSVSYIAWREARLKALKTA